MTLPGFPAELISWSKSTRSECYLYQPCDVVGIARVLEAARSQRFSVIPHGAGHSYTDSALNTGGLVVDLTAMRRILSWDPVQGILCVEPGVRMRDVVRLAAPDGWWPAVTPSTPDVTIGGCAAMNVNGTNAWKCGPFGATILSLEVLLAGGEMCTLTPGADPQLFQAFVGSLGLLGILTSITIQLRRIGSGTVSLGRHSAASLDQIFDRFAEQEPASDFMEAWIDGFATGAALGRGHLTAAALSNAADRAGSSLSMHSPLGRLETPLAGLAAGALRPALLPAMKLVNQAGYWISRREALAQNRKRTLYPFTYWSPAALSGYHRLFPEGVETFQAFVPGPQAAQIFRQVLSYSQRKGFIPVWCVIKQHRRDPYLLSYQVDGFSLELNYPRTSGAAGALKQVLLHMIAAVLEAGGRFYLAKDHFLTHAQYRQSLGDERVETFLRLKQRYDPEELLQSDIYRRVFEPGLA